MSNIKVIRQAKKAAKLIEKRLDDAQRKGERITVQERNQLMVMLDKALASIDKKKNKL